MRNLMIFSLMLAVFAVSSCKKCVPEEDTATGDIVTTAIVRFGGKIYDEPSKGIVRSEAENYAEFEISFNQGQTYEAIDWSLYSVMYQSSSVSCSAQYNRSVTIDDINGTVLYQIDIKECPKCGTNYRLFNAVIVNKVPAGHVPIYNITTSEN